MFILKNVYTFPTMPDRGFKKIKEANGQSILYEPDSKITKYIKQYILAERNGVKQFICRLDIKVRYIDYDIFVYDDSGRGIKVINVKEAVENCGYSTVTELPAETAYVTVVLLSVNGKKIGNKEVTGSLAKKLALYLLLSSAADVLAVIVMKICGAKLFGGLFGESFILSGGGWGVTVALCALAVIANVAFTAVFVMLKFIKGTRRDGK